MSAPLLACSQALASSPSLVPATLTPSLVPAKSTPSLALAMSTPSIPPKLSSPSPALELPPPSDHGNGIHHPGDTQLVGAPNPLDPVCGGPDPGDVSAVTEFFLSYSINADEPQPVTPVRASPQENATLGSSLEHGAPRNMDCGPPPNLLANITNEPVWMKRRRTLHYFRDVTKLGCLSNVIQHWYELERLLGFPGTVSSR